MGPSGGRSERTEKGVKYLREGKTRLNNRRVIGVE